MEAFRGTWRLVRLALRRDRIKLPLWLLIIVATPAASGPALETAYKTLEDRLLYASTTAPSVLTRALAGAIDGPELGSIMMMETFVWTAVMITFMSTLAITRHTRHNEENGASELIMSGVVGKFANLSAALIVALGANVAAALAIFAAVAASGVFSTGGSLLYALTLAGVGVSFSGVAAIAVQLTDGTRSANSISGLSIGVAFLVRAVGDSFGELGTDGISVDPHWTTYFSPLSWGFQVRPFTDQNIVWFAATAVFLLATTSIGFFLVQRRDDGYGIFEPKDGRPRAKRSLLSPLGLAWQLQKSTFIGWSIGFAVLGLVIGGMATEFEDFFLESDFGAQFLEALGGGSGSNFSDLFFAAMFALMGSIAVAYCIQALSRLRGEESKTHLESVLGASVSRIGWMLSHVFIMAVGAVTIMLIMGVVSAVTFGLFADVEIWPMLERLVPAVLIPLPAIFTMTGLITLVFGLLPRLTTAVSWGSFVVILLITQFAALLKFPDWVADISPFQHLPSAPASTSIDSDPLIVLSVIAVISLVGGLLFFRRRDLALN